MQYDAFIGNIGFQAKNDKKITSRNTDLWMKFPYSFTLTRYIFCAYSKWSGVRLTQTSLSMLAIVGMLFVHQRFLLPLDDCGNHQKSLFLIYVTMLPIIYVMSPSKFPTDFSIRAKYCTHGRSNGTDWPDMLDNPHVTFVMGLLGIYDLKDMRWWILSSSIT